MAAGFRVDRYRAQIAVSSGSDASATFERVRHRLFAYDIFPPFLFRYAICPAGAIRGGVTIVQRLVLGPIAMEMAVRIIDIWDRWDGDLREAGLTYVTVRGHAECGIATFRVRLDREQQVTVEIEARSQPGLLLTRLIRPIARTLQVSLTKAALRRLASK